MLSRLRKLVFGIRSRSQADRIVEQLRRVIAWRGLWQSCSARRGREARLRTMPRASGASASNTDRAAPIPMLSRSGMAGDHSQLLSTPF